MNKNKPLVLFALALSMIGGSAAAFETETHALITQVAYQRSSLAERGPGSVVERLMLDRLAEAHPFHAYWLEPGGNRSAYYQNVQLPPDNGADLHKPDAFERCQMREFLPSQNEGVPLPYKDYFVQTVAEPGEPALFPIPNWLVRGAIREDDLGPWLDFVSLGANCGWYWYATTFGQPGGIARPLNHFYDPWLDVGLTTPLVSGEKSVNWALGYVDSFANPPQVDAQRENSYSYTDARDAYWWALTRQYRRGASPPYSAEERELDARDRMRLWATTFRALGNVVHVLEDAGQPQHTRNDAHSMINSPQAQAFEGYTNARVLGFGDVGDYVRGFFGGKPEAEAPKLDNYPSTGTRVMFSTPLRFFTTRGTEPNMPARAGLADYTNRGFFTGGTLPGMPTENGFPHPFPPSLDTDYGVVVAPCEGLLDADPRLAAVTCTHFTHAVPDAVAPGYADDLPAGFTEPPLVSESIFKKIIWIENPPDPYMAFEISETALGMAELNTIGNMTIPRAIGYASGMMDFFFRGQLEVSASENGVVAVLNHGTPHHAQAGYPIRNDSNFEVFGFEQARLRVRNTTPAINESGTGRVVDQTTGGAAAQLVAVAHYHRSPCYQPDLSGEVISPADGGALTMPSGCATPPFDDLTSLRSSYQEISVSAPIPIFGSGSLDGSEGTEFSFDFSADPIPVNATDLYFQVVYRGPLGDERDGIAVGSLDVSEPTYWTFVNAVNYEKYADQPAGTWQYLLNDEYWEGITTISFCVDDALVFRFHDGEVPDQFNGLQENRFLRIAMLLDPGAHDKKVVLDNPARPLESLGFYPDDPVIMSHTGMQGIVYQAETELGEMYVPAFRTDFLGMAAGDPPVDYYATYWEYYEHDGLPHYGVFHPGNPDDTIYYATPPLPFVDGQLMYLPDPRGQVFGTDVEGYCTLSPP